jgi:hypothetical protein
MSRTVSARWRTLGIAASAFLAGVLASQCSQRVSARTRIEDGRPIDRSIDITTYNCAGLAFRSYRYMTLAEVRDVLSHCQELPRPDAPCPAGWVKIWAWEYDVHRETDAGLISASRKDGHVVAGRTNPVDGKGPSLVYSKYAGGPIAVPAPPRSWAPPAREEVGRNAFGQKVFVVRQNCVERWYCSPADGLQRVATGGMPAASAAAQ